jgi:hypothetical protein
VYIDGNHDLEVSLGGCRFCRDAPAPGALLGVDDSPLNADSRLRAFDFAGHTGRYRVIKEYALRELELIVAVVHNNVFREA